MHGNSTFHDMKIRCGNEVIPCNKFILCARYLHLSVFFFSSDRSVIPLVSGFFRSEVFRAMFSHPSLKEAQENQVTITDTDPATVRDMVEFIYTDKVENVCLEVNDMKP